MQIFFPEQTALELPPGHRFPAAKFPRLYQRVRQAGLVPAAKLQQAAPVSLEEVLRVHQPEYVSRFLNGQLTDKEIRRIGLPWSPELVERTRKAIGCTLSACRAALQEGLSANLAGGTHHAYPEHGEGYCILNDVAIAARAMQVEGRARRILVIDLDVHQGNGTAAIFANDPSVYTFSVHGAKNFPFHKEQGDLDIALPDGSRDEAYLFAVHSGLNIAVPAARADLALYIAGADPFEGDQLGRMALSKAGLAERDRLVFQCCQDACLPVAVVMGGGYARSIEDTIDIQFQTIQLAVATFLQSRRKPL